MKFTITHSRVGGTQDIEADRYQYEGNNTFVTFYRERPQGGAIPVLTMRADDVVQIELVEQAGNP